MGTFCAAGKGVERDKAQAAAWFIKAAERGDAMGQFCLSLCYAGGDGVKQDIAASLRWLKKAAEQDLPAAVEALERLE